MICRRCHTTSCPGCPVEVDCVRCGEAIDLDHCDDRGRCAGCVETLIAEALALHARAHRTGHTTDRDRADAALTRWAHFADHLSDAEALDALDLSRPVFRPSTPRSPRCHR